MDIGGAMATTAFVLTAVALLGTWWIQSIIRPYEPALSPLAQRVVERALTGPGS